MNTYNHLLGKCGTVIQPFPGQAFVKVEVESNTIVAMYDRHLVKLVEQDLVKIITWRFGYYVVIPITRENEA